MAIGELLIRIGADLTGLFDATDQADDKIAKFGSSMQNVGGNLSKYVTAPLLAVGGVAVASAVNLGGFADTLLDLADQTGLSTDTLQEFRHVATMAGVDSDTLANATMKLTTGLSGSGDESKQLTGALEQLGLSARDATTGALVPMDKLMPSIINKLQGMDDQTHRNAIAGDIFGRSWTSLAPVLGLGADGMDDARKQARELGLVMSNESLSSANEFRQTMEILKSTVGASTREIGSSLVPVLITTANFLQNNVVPAVQSVTQWFGNMSPEMQKATLVIGGVAAAIGPLLVVGATLVTSASAIALAFGTTLPLAFAKVLPFLGPAGWIAGGIIAAGVVWMTWGDDIKRITGDTVTAVTGWLDKLAAPFRRVAEGVQIVTGTFRNMWDQVVGHSYVPDMVDAIGYEFGRLDPLMVQPAIAGTQQVSMAFLQMADQTMQATHGLDLAFKNVATGAAGAADSVASSGSMISKVLGSLGGSGIAGGIGSLLAGGGSGGIAGAITGGIMGLIPGGSIVNAIAGPLISKTVGKATGWVSDKVGGFIGGLFGKKKKKDAPSPSPAPSYAPPVYSPLPDYSTAYDSEQATAELRTHTSLLQAAIATLQESSRENNRRLDTVALGMDEVRKQIRSNATTTFPT